MQYVLRQAPDVIRIGGMRDVETSSADETADRIINMFPPQAEHYFAVVQRNALTPETLTG